MPTGLDLQGGSWVSVLGWQGVSRKSAGRGKPLETQAQGLQRDWRRRASKLDAVDGPSRRSCGSSAPLRSGFKSVQPEIRHVNQVLASGLPRCCKYQSWMNVLSVSFIFAARRNEKLSQEFFLSFLRRKKKHYETIRHTYFVQVRSSSF